MKDYYKHTNACLRRFNEISDKILNGKEATHDEEDEFLLNFPLYLAQALVSDAGFSETAREQLTKMAGIINEAVI